MVTTSTLTLIAPTCTCCQEPTGLIPRDDLPGNMAVCPNSGQLYRPAGDQYIPAVLPPIEARRPLAPSVQIDLSRSGYA